MRGNSLKGVYVPNNPEKYIGSHRPVWRSTWELTIMRMADNHPSVIKWASEPVKIPYQNPLTGKYTVYVPDFLLVYEDKFGNKKAEIIEIKPEKETLVEAAKSQRDKARLVVNLAKWKAAESYCKSKGIIFRVINEKNIFRKPKR